MVAVDNVSKYYGSFCAIDDISFTLQPGQITGLIGPNGAGKTTIISSILGLAHIAHGSVTVDGGKITQLHNPSRTIGATLGGETMTPGLTVQTIMNAARIQAGVPKAHIDELLATVDILYAKQKRVSQLSMGMRQRLSIAVAMIGDPDILVLDEPANGLDPEGILWLRGYLLSLARSGKSILISSHLLDEISNLVDNIIVIYKGKLLYNDTIEALTSSVDSAVKVGASNTKKLTAALDKLDLQYELEHHKDSAHPDAGKTFLVHGISQGDLSQQLFDAQVVVNELSSYSTSLEDLYLGLQRDHDEQENHTEVSA